MINIPELRSQVERAHRMLNETAKKSQNKILNENKEMVLKASRKKE